MRIIRRFIFLLCSISILNVSMGNVGDVDLSMGNVSRSVNQDTNSTQKSLPQIAPMGNMQLHGYDQSLSLQEAIMLALRFNPDVQNAEIQRIADKWSLKDAYYQFQPQFSISGSVLANGGQGNVGQSQFTPQVNYETPFGTQISAQVSTDRYGSQSSPSVSFNLTQPLLQGFGLDVVQANLNDAKDQEIINRLNLKNQIITTVVTVVTAYRSLQESLYNVQTNQLAVTSDAATLRQDQILIKAGKKAPSDIIESQSQAATDNLSLEQAQNQVQQNKLTLLNDIGLSPETRFKVPSTITVPKVKLPVLQDAINIALRNNIQYQEDLINLKIQRRAVITALSKAKWQLDLQATGTWTKTQNINVNDGNIGIAQALYARPTPNYNNGNNSGNGGGNNSNNGNNPTISPSPSFILPPGTAFQTTIQSQDSVGLVLNIPLDDIDNTNSIVAAKVALRQQEISLRQERRELSMKLINDYENINSDYQQLLQAQQALQLEEKNMQNQREQLIYGLISTFEINHTQRDLVSSRSSLASAQITFSNDLTTLGQDMGETLHYRHIIVRY